MCWNQKGKRRRWKPKWFRTVWKGVNVDPKGRQERAQVKNSRRQSEGEEIKSPKRKIIWVESEDTLDHVREAKDMDQEEAEEMSFVPSAISVPRKLLFLLDTQCSDKTLQLLAVGVGGDQGG